MLILALLMKIDTFLAREMCPIVEHKLKTALQLNCLVSGTRKALPLVEVKHPIVEQELM
jgi:hypothetical protein